MGGGAAGADGREGGEREGYMTIGGRMLGSIL